MKHLLKSREIWLFLALVAVVIGTTLRSPAFGSFDNLLGIFNNSSMLIILALGQMVVIITRSIDLSMTYKRVQENSVVLSKEIMSLRG